MKNLNLISFGPKYRFTKEINRDFMINTNYTK
jgi:hypothetical protein